MKKPSLTKEQRAALSGIWSYDTAVLIVGYLRKDIGDAWDWMTPRVREALVAERCFQPVRARHSEIVEVKDMDLLLNAMRVVAGLAEIDEVL